MSHYATEAKTQINLTRKKRRGEKNLKKRNEGKKKRGEGRPDVLCSIVELILCQHPLPYKARMPRGLPPLPSLTAFLLLCFHPTIPSLLVKSSGLSLLSIIHQLPFISSQIIPPIPLSSCLPRRLPPPAPPRSPARATPPTVVCFD